MESKRIGILGFDGVNTLHLTGLAEAFKAAALDDGYGGRIACYEVAIVGAPHEHFRTESGLEIVAHTSLREAPEFDTIIVAGGCGARDPRIGEMISDWLLKRAEDANRIASICAGIFLVAPTGLLDGREVTIHWRFARALAQRFPSLKIDHKKPLVRDGCYYTSSGLSAGLNLALAMIQEDYGPHVARAVGAELRVLQTCEEEAAKPSCERLPNERFADLVPWIVRNLQGDLSVETLARRACMCPDNFSKAFKSVFGEPPKLFVENLRLNEARRRLSRKQKTVRSVAESVGFRNSDQFQKAFERRFGTRPSRCLASTENKTYLTSVTQV